jgi:hypothetical protein
MAISPSTSGFSSAFTGFSQSQQQMAQAAQVIADPAQMSSTAAVSTTDVLIDLHQASTQSLALLKLIETQDDILGRIIDTWA